MAWNGQRLRRIRQLKRITQKVAADLMAPISDEMGLGYKISHKMLSDYELGKEQPRADALSVICKALDVPSDYLLELIDYPVKLSSAEYKTVIKKRGGSNNALNEFILQTMLDGGFGD